MKKLLYFLCGFTVMATIAYFLGPKPTKPNLSNPSFSLPENPEELNEFIVFRESENKNIKKDNQAEIIWADSTKKSKTEYAIVYIHGFSASKMEGNPVHKNLAKKIGANLYLPRLAEHGLEVNQNSMINLTADALINSAEESLEIAKRLGQKVIVIGCSMGGALSLHLASKHPEIHSLVLYSPCVEIFDKSTRILNDPWGLQIAQRVNGSKVHSFDPKIKEQSNYWTTSYRLEALVALENLIENTMTTEAFKAIKCPTYLAYYFKNEEEQDQVVSVPAMLKMFNELGSTNKSKQAFPESKNHVIASSILSEDWQSVQEGTEKFIYSVMGEKKDE